MRISSMTILVVLSAFFALLLAGCGGSSNSSDVVKTGTMSFTVKWPVPGVASSRAIPLDAIGIRIALLDADNHIVVLSGAEGPYLAEFDILKPIPPATTTTPLVITNIPVGTYKIQSNSYDNTYDALSSATMSDVLVEKDKTTSPHLVLNATFDVMSLEYPYNTYTRPTSGLWLNPAPSPIVTVNFVGDTQVFTIDPAGYIEFTRDSSSTALGSTVDSINGKLSIPKKASTNSAGILKVNAAQKNTTANTSCTVTIL